MGQSIQRILLLPDLRTRVLAMLGLLIVVRIAIRMAEAVW